MARAVAPQALRLEAVTDMADATFPRAEEPQVLSVTALTARIRDTLESSLQDVYVVGEVSRCTRAASGHIYLTLKDEGAVLRAVIWRGVASSLRFKPEEGVEIIARGSVDVYPPRGSYQLIIRWLEPRGLGALQLAFEKLKARLEKEGLFAPELKKPLPPWPRRIGIVTSPTGAAVRDIINVIARRYPVVDLYLMPCRVQGAEAAAEIAAAIDRLNQRMAGLDLIIVGRGGGSLEDLWAFNEEVVARAIHRSAIPIVSAVGHEIDFSISDFVADVRAATPTEAGEIVVPDRAEVLESVRGLARRMALGLRRALARDRQRVEALGARYVFRRPEAMLRERAQRADDLFERMRTALSHRLALLRETMEGASRRLEALSPLKVLERGYSLTLDAGGRALRGVEGLSAGDTVRTRLWRGEIVSHVSAAHQVPVAGGEEGGD